MINFRAADEYAHHVAASDDIADDGDVIPSPGPRHQEPGRLADCRGGDMMGSVSLGHPLPGEGATDTLTNPAVAPTDPVLVPPPPKERGNLPPARQSGRGIFPGLMR